MGRNNEFGVIRTFRITPSMWLKKHEPKMILPRRVTNIHFGYDTQTDLGRLFGVDVLLGHFEGRANLYMGVK